MRLFQTCLKMPSNYKRSTITIAAAEEKIEYKEVIVSVKDTGTGIDPEILPRLFTKFSSKSVIGTGLGLFLSKNIVEAQGAKYGPRITKMAKEQHLHLAYH
jgi:signal transduction histidine kinase